MNKVSQVVTPQNTNTERTKVLAEPDLYNVRDILKALVREIQQLNETLKNIEENGIYTFNQV